MSIRKAIQRLVNKSLYVITFKLVANIVRALVTLEPSDLTGNFYLDWTRLQHWIGGRLIAIEFGKQGPLEIIDESESNCWEELFYSKGWNSYARTKQSNISLIDGHTGSYSDCNSTEESHLR